MIPPFQQKRTCWAMWSERCLFSSQAIITLHAGSQVFPMLACRSTPFHGCLLYTGPYYMVASLSARNLISLIFQLKNPRQHFTQDHRTHKLEFNLILWIQ